MKITVISGSMRNGSQTLEVSKYIRRRLESLSVDVGFIDLNLQRLPLFDDNPESGWLEMWRPIEAEMASADGFVLVSPEWDGMFSAGLHNLFNYVASGSDQSVMGHKPVMLVTVSSGLGGAYPLAQLRMTGPKNTHFVVVPDNIRVAKVKEVFVDGEFTVEALRERAEYSITMLLVYAEALAMVRRNPAIDQVTFASGV